MFPVKKRGDGITPTKVKVINSTVALRKHIKPKIPSPNIPGSFEHLRFYLFFNSFSCIFNRSITYKYPNIHRDVSLPGTKNNKPRKAQIEGTVCSL